MRCDDDVVRSFDDHAEGKTSPVSFDFSDRLSGVQFPEYFLSGNVKGLLNELELFQVRSEDAVEALELLEEKRICTKIVDSISVEDYVAVVR